jgi:hypothetical protein
MLYLLMLTSTTCTKSMRYVNWRYKLTKPQKFFSLSYLLPQLTSNFSLSLIMASSNNVAQEENVWECSICLDDDDRECMQHECRLHTFHKVCLDRVKLTSLACPLCRFIPPTAMIPLLVTMTRHFGLMVPEPCRQCGLPITYQHTFWQFAVCRHRIHNGCYNGNAHCPAC